MSWFKSKQEQLAANLYEEQVYSTVAEEVVSKNIFPGIWAKAFAEANGNELLAKAAYIKLRVAQLKLEADAAVEMLRTMESSFSAPREAKHMPSLSVDTGHGSCVGCNGKDLEVGNFDGGRAFRCRGCGKCSY